MTFEFSMYTWRGSMLVLQLRLFDWRLRAIMEKRDYVVHVGPLYVWLLI